MSISSQNLESFLPLYDQIPYEWSEAQQFLVEQMRLIAEAVNARSIGFYLEEQLLSGKQFTGLSTSPQIYRDIFRKVVNVGPLAVGINTIAHGINFDSNFTLINMWVAATKSTAPFKATTIVSEPELYMDATDLKITSSSIYDRAYAIIEYILEA